jgi:hypothetical protein
MCAENEPAFYKMPAIWPTTMGNIGCTIAIFIGNLLKTHGDSNPVISWMGEFRLSGLPWMRHRTPIQATLHAIRCPERADGRILGTLARSSRWGIFGPMLEQPDRAAECLLSTVHPAAPNFRRRVPVLPPMGRTVARSGGRTLRHRALPERSGALSRTRASFVRTGRAINPNGRAGLLRGGGGASHSGPAHLAQLASGRV